MTTEQDPHLSVGAYVLYALPPAEAASFENHLAGCDACRREVSDLREIAAGLGELAPVVQLTPAARTRTLQLVASTRQDRTVVRMPTRRSRVLRFALAASVAVAAALGGTAVWQHTQADDARARAAYVEQQSRTASAAVTDVLTAPDASLHTEKLSGGTTAAVVVSRAEERAVFAAQGLPPLSRDKVYELWYAADTGDLRSAGLLPSDPDGSYRLLEGSPTGAVAVGISVEPAGGSEQPTTEPLGIVPLTA